MFSYFVTGQVRIIFFNFSDEDVFNMKTDIDQSNGKFYMVMDYENSATLADGSEVLFSTITTSTTWYNSGWGGFYFEGVLNTDIVADNKNCYIVGEVDNGGSGISSVSTLRTVVAPLPNQMSPQMLLMRRTQQSH